MFVCGVLCSDRGLRRAGRGGAPGGVSLGSSRVEIKAARSRRHLPVEEPGSGLRAHNPGLRGFASPLSSPSLSLSGLLGVWIDV